MHLISDINTTRKQDDELFYKVRKLAIGPKSKFAKTAFQAITPQAVKSNSLPEKRKSAKYGWNNVRAPWTF